MLSGVFEDDEERGVFVHRLTSTFDDAKQYFQNNYIGFSNPIRSCDYDDMSISEALNASGDRHINATDAPPVLQNNPDSSL